MTDNRHPAGHLLQAFHDGELDQIQATEVKRHCEQCETCRAELDGLELMEELLASSVAPELPRTVWHRVKPGRITEPRFKPIFGLVAGALGVLLGILLGPVQFNAEKAADQMAWSETVTVWDVSSSSSLLGVFQTDQD